MALGYMLLKLFPHESHDCETNPYFAFAKDNAIEAQRYHHQELEAGGAFWKVNYEPWGPEFPRYDSSFVSSAAWAIFLSVPCGFVDLTETPIDEFLDPPGGPDEEEDPPVDIPTIDPNPSTGTHGLTVNFAVRFPPRRF